MNSLSTVTVHQLEGLWIGNWSQLQLLTFSADQPEKVFNRQLVDLKMTRGTQSKIGLNSVQFI